MTKLNETLKEHGYENAMHFVCEILCEQFENSDADNYIEMTFADKEDENKSYVLTMQKASGITPCQKIDTLTEQNRQLVEALDEFDRHQGNDNDYLNSPFCAKVRELLFKHGACQEDERPKLKEHELIAKHKEQI